MEKKLIFLGGTVGNNPWRTTLIKDLSEKGIHEMSLFNPVVPEWNEEAMKKEEEAKLNATHFLFYIGSPMQQGLELSSYSMVEATMALYDNPDKTIVAFCDHQMLSGHALKAMKQTENVLRKRFPTARIVNGFDKLKEELIILLGDV